MRASRPGREIWEGSGVTRRRGERGGNGGSISLRGSAPPREFLPAPPQPGWRVRRRPAHLRSLSLLIALSLHLIEGSAVLRNCCHKNDFHREIGSQTASTRMS